MCVYGLLTVIFNCCLILTKFEQSQTSQNIIKHTGLFELGMSTCEGERKRRLSQIDKRL